MKNKIWKWGLILGLTILALWLIISFPLIIAESLKVCKIPTWWNITPEIGTMIMLFSATLGVLINLKTIFRALVDEINGK